MLFMNGNKVKSYFSNGNADSNQPELVSVTKSFTLSDCIENPENCFSFVVPDSVVGAAAFKLKARDYGPNVDIYIYIDGELEEEILWTVWSSTARERYKVNAGQEFRLNAQDGYYNIKDLSLFSLEISYQYRPSSSAKLYMNGNCLLDPDAHYTTHGLKLRVND